MSEDDWLEMNGRIWTFGSTGIRNLVDVLLSFRVQFNLAIAELREIHEPMTVADSTRSAGIDCR